MSLTSYRAAPPRVGAAVGAGGDDDDDGDEVVAAVVGRGGWWTWRRPTLPRLETQYHGRGGVSRPSSEWGRVGHPRYGHQVEQAPSLRTTPASEQADRFRGRTLGAAAGKVGMGGRRHMSDRSIDRASDRSRVWLPLEGSRSVE